MTVDAVIDEQVPEQQPHRPSLSPSRAADFKTCPLLYRFRSIDRLPERPSPDQARGTLVHAVLERLFDLPAAERTPEQAAELIEPQCRLLLRGYIDRLDVSPGGELRVVDYKSGGAPREAFEARALFQLKFYALVLWRTRGVVPRVLRLLYLKDAEICDYTPDIEELARFERTLIALWAAIEKATARQDFRPRPSRLCGWCAHQALCPAFDGTPPPFPQVIPVPPAEP